METIDSHEDGYAISEETSQKFITDSVEEVTCIIPLNTKITSSNFKIGNITSSGDKLLEFAYVGNIDDYIDAYNLMDSQSEESDIALYDALDNKIVLHSPGGEILQVKIFMNNQNQTDPSVTNLWKELTDDLKERQALYAKNAKNPKDKLKSQDNLDLSQLRIGTHKYFGKLFEGTRISFFIKRSKPLKMGDKMSCRYGAKGVVSIIIPLDKTPKGKYTGDIDIFISAIGVLNRKNFVIVKELYLGKIFYFLPDIIAKKAEDNRIPTKVISDLVLSIYNMLDETADKRYSKTIEAKIKSISPAKLRDLFKNKMIKFNYIVQPFEKISFERLQEAAKLLNIPLDEKVFIPETGTWTKRPVPVGIQYFNAMEQLSEDFETLRSTGGYGSVTGLTGPLY